MHMSSSYTQGHKRCTLGQHWQPTCPRYACANAHTRAS